MNPCANEYTFLANDEESEITAECTLPEEHEGDHLDEALKKTWSYEIL